MKKNYMTGKKFLSFQVKHFRSLKDVTLDMCQYAPTVICGENNIGKTNFIRALNLFFNHLSDAKFNPQEDLPYHILYGSGGSGAKTELIGKFEDESKLKHIIKIIFKKDGEIQYQINSKDSKSEDIFNFLNNFRFIFIESHNINLPQIIATILEQDGLLSLDKKRSKQSKPLQKLQEFITLSQQAINDIERDINLCFASLTDFEGILKDKQVKIYFAEFEKLRDVVKTMTEITLFDGNSLSISSKGSGAQRALFLALIQYISKNSKQNVIWGVDEPEAFLQPKLQKKVASVFSEITKSENQKIIITTHSQHFINLKDLSATYLFKGKQEEKNYARRPGKKFVEMSASPVKEKSSADKAYLIKEHLGISANDGWELMPFNILVEGEEDKKYLEALFRLSNCSCPNIVWAGGASKIGGYLQFYNDIARDLEYEPKIICLFDNDDEGRTQANKVKPRSIPHIEAEVLFPPRYDGKKKEESRDKWEIEDFMPPELMIEAINLILKIEGYKIIKKKQKEERRSLAHLSKGILKYSEECCSANNPDREKFQIDNESRKKQICLKVCEIIQSEDYDLSSQISFLENSVMNYSA